MGRVSVTRRLLNLPSESLNVKNDTGSGSPI